MNILLKNQIKKAESLGFWDDIYVSIIKTMIEGSYKTSIIREYSVADLVLNGDKMLIKWEKRFRPLTDEELMDLGFQLDSENNLDNSTK
jgi:hypothetical protein